MILLLTAWAADAEGERIVEEMPLLVRDGKWIAVERAYQRLLADHPSVITSEVHRMGAGAARARGDLLRTAQRLQRVRTGTVGHPESVGDLALLAENTGLVRVEADGVELATDALPFAPELRLAVEGAIEQTRAEGWFVGLLPVGTYRLGDRTFEVSPGFDAMQVVRPRE